MSVLTLLLLLVLLTTIQLYWIHSRITQKSTQDPPVCSEMHDFLTGKWWKKNYVKLADLQCIPRNLTTNSFIYLPLSMRSFRTIFHSKVNAHSSDKPWNTRYSTVSPIPKYSQVLNIDSDFRTIYLTPIFKQNSGVVSLSLASPVDYRSNRSSPVCLHTMLKHKDGPHLSSS